MTAAPGFVWLLRHELRLAVRVVGIRRSLRARMVPLLLLAIVPAAGGIALAIVLALGRNAKALPLAETLLGPAGAAVAALFVLMVSTAAIGVLRTFHDRGDLDLLLAAPVPPSRILAAKAVGVAVTVATPFVVLVAPFALTSALLGAPRWLGTLVMVGLEAALATAAAIAFTGVLATAVGPRRARVTVQLAAAAVGGSVFLLSQSQSLAPGFARHVYLAINKPWPTPFDWPARAAIGQPLPLAVMAALTVLAAWAAARYGARHLAAAGTATLAPVRARTAVVRFRPGLARNVIAKELRLIARDPELITQVALRLVYLIPMAALIARGKPGTDPGPALAGTVTAFAALLASSLAWIVVAAEDAPDLLAAAPRPAARIARAKLVAATLIPVVLVGAAATAAAAIAGPWTAAVTAGMGLFASLCAAQVQAWFGRPAPRATFRRRQAGSFAVGLGEVILAATWSGTAALLVRRSVWTLAPAICGGAILAGALEARPRGQRTAAPGGPGAAGGGSSSSVSSAAMPRQPA